MITIFLEQFFRELINLFLMAAPYLLVGVVVGALFDRYFRIELVEKFFLKSKFSILIATLLGSMLPGCAMTTMPMALSLRKKGVALSTLATFIFVAPLLSPHIMILSWGVLGTEFTVARLVFSVVGALFLGYVLLFLEKKGVLSFPVNLAVDTSAACCGGCKEEQPQTFLQSCVSISKDLGKYFLIGAVIASLLMALVPPTFFADFLDRAGIFEYPIAAFAGIPLYVCEGEEIPLTLSLLTLGVRVGPAMTFMLGALGTCIPTILMTQKIIGKKATLIYVLYWFIFAMASGWVFQAVSGLKFL
jgi:uncharacterized membrane protein YraQ (UPF0718 family)